MIKKSVSFFLVFCFGLMLCGCQQTKTIIKVMYGVHSIAYSSEAEQSKPYLEAVQRLNKALSEKGLPYEVEIDFVMVDYLSTQDDLDKMHYYEVLDEKMKDKEAYDLIYFPVSGRSRVTLQDLIQKGYVDCLDDYFQSEAGTEVLKAYPHTVMDALKVNGSYYFLPVNVNQSALLDQHYYTYDRNVLNELGLADLEHEQLWVYADEIVSSYLQEAKPHYGLMGMTGKVFAYQEGYAPIEGSTILDTPFVLNEESNQIECILDVKNFQDKVSLIQNLHDAQKQKLVMMETSGYLSYLDEQNRPIQVHAYLINGIENNAPVQVMFDQKYSIIAYGGLGVSSVSTQKEAVYDFLHVLATDQDVNNALKANGELSVLGNLFQSDFSEAAGVNLPYDDKESLFSYVENLPLSEAAGFSFDSSKVRKAYQDIIVYYLNFDSQTLEDTLCHFGEKREIYEELGIDEVLAEMNQQYQLYLQNQS